MEAPGTITKEKLSKLTGIPVARLRQLAADGFFSKAVDGSYKLTDAIQGLFKYYRETSQELPVYDSIDACSGATGIPRGVIKSAKKLGCSAFHSNRVKLGPLLAFIFTEKEGPSGTESFTIDEWKKRKVQEEATLLSLTRKQREGELVLKADITRDIHSATFAFRTEIESIPGKLAPQVVGLSIPEAEIRIAGAIQEALMKLHRDDWVSA